MKRLLGPVMMMSLCAVSAVAQGPDVMKSALEGEVVDRAMAGYTAAENDCAASMEVLNALKPLIAARPTSPEYRWMLVWVSVNLTGVCTFSGASALLKEAVAQLTELRNGAKKPGAAPSAGVSAAVWAQAADALVRSAMGDHGEALRMSHEALRAARTSPLMMITRGSVLWNHGRLEQTKAGEVTAAVRGELQEATGLLSEALRGDLPKSTTNMVNLAQGRIQFLLGDMLLAAQYLRAYTGAEAKNARALWELSDALYRADDCEGARDAAAQSHLLRRTRHALKSMEHATACAESKAAMAESAVDRR